MKKSLFAFLILLTFPPFPAGAKSPETPPLQFVKLYIEQLGAIQTIADNAEKDLKTRGKTEVLSNCIDTMKKYQAELAGQISALGEIRLSKTFAFLPGSLAEYDRQKSALYKQYGENCSSIEIGPKPGIDYNKVAAELPKLREQLDSIDQEIFQTAPAAFAMLIQTRQNSHGGADHLWITKAEKAALIQRIKQLFGARLGQPNENYIVSAASVVDFYLEKKGFKCADDPWE